MGRYVLYHGDVRPSDSYLAEHPDFHYDRIFVLKYEDVG